MDEETKAIFEMQIEGIQALGRVLANSFRYAETKHPGYLIPVKDVAGIIEDGARGYELAIRRKMK